MLISLHQKPNNGIQPSIFRPAFTRSVTMISYQEARDKIPLGETPSVILANGFSQAWDHKIFNYKYLLEIADFGDRDEIIRELFRQVGTHDFEKVMKRLKSTQLVLEVYGAPYPLINAVKQDQEILKLALIDAISTTHPQLPSNVTDAQYECVRGFLSQFNQIFTLNYDLLLYWARNKNDLSPEGYETDDGFRGNPLYWKGHGTFQEIHFLHGALHLYDTVSGVKKHKCTEDGIPIIEQVRDNLEQGKFPLFVSEPTDLKKKSRIEHNPYLNYCYQKISTLRGALFIYGHSIDQNDNHIFEQIRKSQVEHIFVSIFGDMNSAPNRMSMLRAQYELPNIELTFFKAETTPVWSEI